MNIRRYADFWEKEFVFNEFYDTENFFIKLGYIIPKRHFVSHLGEFLTNKTATDGKLIFKNVDLNLKQFKLLKEEPTSNGEWLSVIETYGYAPSRSYEQYSQESYTRPGIEDPTGALSAQCANGSAYILTDDVYKLVLADSDLLTQFQVGDMVSLYAPYQGGAVWYYGVSVAPSPITKIDSTAIYIQAQSGNSLNADGSIRGSLTPEKVGEVLGPRFTASRSVSKRSALPQTVAALNVITFYETAPQNLEQRFQPTLGGEATNVITDSTTPDVDTYKALVAGTITPEQIEGLNGVMANGYVLVEDASLEIWNGLYKKTLKFTKAL